jgi:hypothetical protein
VIAFVAKDSGGANLVLHHALSIQTECKFYLFGVAKEIAAELKIEQFKRNQSVNELTQIISGANFPGEIGEQEILLGKFQAQGIPIDGYLDGWENLANRFPGIDIRNYLVVDDYSEALARKLYPGKVLRVKNFYLHSTLNEFHSFSSIIPQNPNGVLYLSRPKLSDPGSQRLHGENCICTDLRTIEKSLSPTKIVVRDHPSLNSIICISEYSARKGLVICQSRGTSSLAKDLAQCSYAVGAPTPALGIAKDAGLKAYILSSSQMSAGAPSFPILS